ncbi:MAG: hypothetical protein M3O36_15335 [Myxococcota bacterium]|nr:hypothetical protein [Myxococcota bacterium]
MAIARRPSWNGAAVGLSGLLAVLVSTPGYAMDAEVASDTAAQFYDVPSPTGETVLMRRRLTTTLAVSAYNLLDAPPGNPKTAELSFRGRVRYDADYGATGASTDPSRYNSFVPGFSQGYVDLMYGYLEGRRLLDGWLGFKLGRQYVTDALGWWSFDGGEVSLTIPYFVKAEAYGGLEQRGAQLASTGRFERDGVWRGSRTGVDPSLYPAFQPATVAPAFGVALESAGVTWIHGRVTYRRVYNTGASNVTEYPSGLYAPARYDGSRISSERLGYAVDANWPDVGGAKAGVVYDLYRADVTQLYASIDGYLGKRLTLSVDYDYYVPSFDADSIFNFFAAEPMSDLGLRANVDVNDHLSIAGGAHVRVFTVQTGPFNPGVGSSYSPSPNYSAATEYFPTNGHPFDEGGNLSARWHTGLTTWTLRGSGNAGDEGNRVGADLSGQHVFETRYVVSGRAGAWHWNDKIRPDHNPTSFNYVAGLGYRFAPRSQASIEWEHDINKLVGQRFRVMLSLTFAVAK